MSEPTQNYRIVGDGDVEFGSDGAEYTGIGVIVSASREDGGDELELKDRQGNVFIVIFFNDKNECEITVIFDSTATIPVRGDFIDLCGLQDVMVKLVTHMWENEKERQLKIKATRYGQISAP